MKIAVRYQSKSGNTARVARVIAAALDVEAQAVDTPLEPDTDLLFVGGAIYAGNINGKLKRFLKELASDRVKHIAVFSTAAGAKHISPKVEKLLRGKEITLLGREFHAQSGALDAALPDAVAYVKEILLRVSE
jgi:menaquinone-dependent protoporphyrinogen IX oxidase